MGVMFLSQEEENEVDKVSLCLYERESQAILGLPGTDDSIRPISL